MAELYNVYKLDFILFSYKPDIFINAAKGHLTDDKMASLRTFSQPPKPQSINQNFGSIFQIFNFAKPKKITKTSTQKDNIKDKKSLDFLNRAKLKQKLKIDNFNKRVSPSMTSWIIKIWVLGANKIHQVKAFHEKTALRIKDSLSFIFTINNKYKSHN